MAWPLTAAITGLDSDHAGTSMPAALKPGPGSANVCSPAEVGAGAERGRRTGQHDHPHRVVAVAGAVGVGQLVAHPVADRVALPRPVERDGGHTAVDLGVQRAVNGQFGAGGHRLPPVRSGSPAMLPHPAPRIVALVGSRPVRSVHLDPSREIAGTPSPQEVWPGKAYPLGATYDGSGTNFALFSEVAERVELCLFDADGAETRVDAARGRRLRLARLPAQRRAGPALRLPGARPLRSRRGPALQPEQAAARPVRQGDRRHLRLGPVAVRLRLRRPGQPQRRRLRGQHAQVGGDQPVLRLGRRPAAAATSTPTPSSTRRTSRA